MPPSFLLDKTIKGMTGTIAEAAKADGPLIGPLARKTKEIPGDWTNRAAQIVRSAIVPALERQLAELQAERAVAVAAPGLNVRPHGPEWYAWGLRAGTTTRRSAADLHAMGVARLADLQAQMDTILRKEGLTQGSVAERAIAYQKRPGIGFPDGDEGRRQIIAYMQGRIDAIRPRLPDAFRLVRGNLEIRRMPVAQEPGAPAAYGGPGTIDGSVPGKVWVNLGDPSIHNRVTIPDLVYHEGIPGHVWQGEYAQKLPLIRSILAFNAYSEGWALYSEQLADELGMYRDDPAGRLGYLMGLAWRAVRLIVDTGIHAIGWSRDKALAEFIAATGLPRSNAESEVDRYCSWPGQACGYEVGRAEIVAQRTRAQRRSAPLRPARLRSGGGRWRQRAAQRAGGECDPLYRWGPLSEINPRRTTPAAPCPSPRHNGGGHRVRTAGPAPSDPGRQPPFRRPRRVERAHDRLHIGIGRQGPVLMDGERRDRLGRVQTVDIGSRGLDDPGVTVLIVDQHDAACRTERKGTAKLGDGPLGGRSAFDPAHHPPGGQASHPADITRTLDRLAAQVKSPGREGIAERLAHDRRRDQRRRDRRTRQRKVVRGLQHQHRHGHRPADHRHRKGGHADQCGILRIDDRRPTPRAIRSA